MKQETGGPGPNFKVARRPRRVRELRPGQEGSGFFAGRRPKAYGFRTLSQSPEANLHMA